jgi:ribosomal protein S1
MSEISEQSFEQLLKEEGSLNQIHNGAVVKGTVIGVKENEIVLNIGYKADGVISKNEYTNDSSADLTQLVQVGDEMEVKVLKVNDGDGQVVLSYKRLAQDRSSKQLEEAFNNNTVLTAKVSQVLKGGLSVSIDGVRIFIPASLVSDSYERDLTKYQDQDIDFVIIEYNPRRRRIIGDRKQIMVARKAEMKEALMSRIQEGMIVKGKVKNLTDFGGFIDLGGADGLLHISEMSWGRIESPKKLFKVGDEVEAFIKEIKGEKIALSLKFPDRNPWLNAEEKYAVGNIITGHVARMTDFGAFIELEPGIDALLHVSQISKSHVDKPSDVLKIGQEIEAKVVDFNPDERKISLSMKAIEQDAAEEKDAETVFEDVAEPEAAPAVEEAESVAEEAAPAEEEAAPTEEKAEPAAEETAQDAAAAEE